MAPRGGGFVFSWLEAVKDGYGERFAEAFEEIGVEDAEDFEEFRNEGSDMLGELERALAAAGAKPLQLSKIRRALLEAPVKAQTSAAVPPGVLPKGAVTVSVATQAEDEGKPDVAAVAAATAPPAEAAPAPARAEGAFEPAPRVLAERDLEAEVTLHDAKLWAAVLKTTLPAVKLTPFKPSPKKSVSETGMVTLRQGDGPRLYFVHDIDGDPLGRPGECFGELVKKLGNCHCVVFEFGHDAKNCSSLPALAALYALRIKQDLTDAPPGRRAYVAGYGMGCILAYEVATQLDGPSGQVAGLIVFGGEVMWPSPDLPQPDRMGHYQWLGGDFEAPLFVARRYGAGAWAEQEVSYMMTCEEKELDVEQLRMRAFWQQAGSEEMTYEDFMQMVTVGARNMDLLWGLMRDYEPKTAGFNKPALLLLGSDSPEFHAAVEVNKKYCASLRTAYTLGTQYEMLSQRIAPMAANSLTGFLREQGDVVDLSSVALPKPTSTFPKMNGAAPPMPKVPAEQVEQRVLALLKEQVVGDVALDSSLLDSGMDSISMSLFATHVEKDFAVRLPAARIAEFGTVRDVVEAIRTEMPKPSVQYPSQLALEGGAPLAARAVVVNGPPIEGLAVMNSGTGPRLYCVHGIDGDMFAIGSSYASVAPMLAPCNAAVMLYDDKAYAAKSVPALAAVYVGRMLEDAQRYPGSPLCVVGYSFGCVIAHQMAMQLQARGVQHCLVLIDFEVTYPPDESMERLGGYEWLGGDIEATLLLVRGALAGEGIVWAKAETEKLLKQKREDRDVQDIVARAHEAISRRNKAFSYDIVKGYCEKGGRNMERMHTSAANNWAPEGVYRGQALLLLAPGSKEFCTARDVNAKYCSNMQCEYAFGTHYTILQQANAAKVASCIMGFLRRVGCAIPKPPPVSDIKGLVTLCAGEGPRLYMVHGIDGDFMGEGAQYSTISPMLAPCNAAALLLDDEAREACETIPKLVEKYLARVWEDYVNRNPTAPIVMVGYSFGCVIAHQMALQWNRMAPQMGLMTCSLVMVDFEVTYPPDESMERLGGYEWLGGEIEATLLLMRGVLAVEGIKWAEVETKRMLALKPEERDTADLRRRGFALLTSRRKGFDQAMFDAFVAKGGRNMQRIHTATGKWAPDGTFEEEALLILAQGSKEFCCARDINAHYCSKMEVKMSFGTHYSIMQPPNAAKTANCITGFLRRLGYTEVPEAPVPDDPGIVTLATGDGARLYCVHGIDGDFLSTGAAFTALAALLAPCNAVAFAYDEEARKCDSLTGLAWLYLTRMWQDFMRNPAAKIFIVGYSFGCVIAHQMAFLAEKVKAEVSLILVDFEVVYPPAPTANADRLGAYEWLGGKIEAALLMCRSVSSVDGSVEGIMWAQKETEALLKQTKSERKRNTEAFQKRAFDEVISKRKGFKLKDFEMICERGGFNMDRIVKITGDWKPDGVFNGETLLVLAPESKEFHSAQKVNGQYCSKMEVAYAAGTHYSILQGRLVAKAASRIVDFLRRLGQEMPDVPDAPEVPGVLTLHPGTDDGAQLYFVHDMDGDVLSERSAFAALAPMLGPCRACALVYDEEAQKCKTLRELGAVYGMRMYNDHQRRGGQVPCAVVGYGFGCVLAHLLALQAQDVGVPPRLVLVDSEVTYPHATRSSDRLGGYDFLGGAIEAPLLLARSRGAAEWAADEVRSLSALPASQRQAEDVRRRAVDRIVPSGDTLARDALDRRCLEASRIMDLLHAASTIADGGRYVPAAQFHGETLHLRAQSPEFRSASDTNKEFCISLRTTGSAGSHYSVLAAEHAPASAGTILEFLGSPTAAS